jgi:hypothetical protein
MKFRRDSRQLNRAVTPSITQGSPSMRRIEATWRKIGTLTRRLRNLDSFSLAFKTFALLGRPSHTKMLTAKEKRGQLSHSVADSWSLRGQLCQLGLKLARRAAQSMFALARAAAGNASQLQLLFEKLHLTFPPRRCTRELIKLYAALMRLRDRSTASTILSLNIRIALRDYSGFLLLYERARRADAIDPKSLWGFRFGRLALILNGPKLPDFTALKIFGIGLTKTGTVSLNTALGKLGFLSAHYNNVFSRRMLAEEDAFIFDAMTDTPVCIQFEALYHRFPNAKFIYTTRPYDEWEASYRGHCMKLYGTTDFDVLRTIPALRRFHPYVTDVERIDCALFFRYRDICAAHAAYQRRVTGFFSDKPKDKLLTLQVGSGREWEQICEFLDRKVPDEAFPWDNKAIRRGLR